MPQAIFFYPIVGGLQFPVSSARGNHWRAANYFFAMGNQWRVANYCMFYCAHFIVNYC
jgi:hypothetical protein